MRRRSAALATLSAGVLLVLTTGALAAPASAADAPAPSSSLSAPAPSSSPSAPTSDAPVAEPTDPGTISDDAVDLSLTPVFGTELGPVARGAQTGLSFSVSGTSSGATVTLTVPAGLTFVGADLDQSAVACAPAGVTVVCDLPAVSGLPLFTAKVLVPAGTAIGTHLTVGAVLAPLPGPDLNPGDNAASIGLDVVGRADVSVSRDIDQLNIPLGGSGSFTLTLHNDGPDPATGLRTGFAIQSNDDPRPVLSAFSSPDVTPGNGSYVWQPAPLAAGASVSLTVTVTATSPAVDSFVSYSTRYDAVPLVCGDSPSCEFGVRVRTVDAATSGPGTAANPSTPELANTGSPDTTLGLVALGLLAGGATLTAAGRRRRTT